MKVGDLEVTAVNDGEFVTGPEYFGDSVSFTGHQDLLAPDGKLHLPIGCFVLQGGPLGDRTILIDAGLGEMSSETYVGGRLIGELAAAGIRPDAVDTVICSHLHIDHCGWLVNSSGEPVFTNATIWAGSADWQRFVVDGADLMLAHVRQGLQPLFEQGKVVLVDGDTSVAPGVSTMAAPGHTPGHLVIVVSDQSERAILLGDAISCPVQLDEPGWGAVSDVDPALARRTRERMWAELEASGDRGVGAHFPGLHFGRLLRGVAGRKWI